ncbi:response regulator, partial [Thermodesulfobacteriota bacterium]
LLTSLGRKGDAAYCRKIGISGYLMKPIKQSELLDGILMALGRQSQEIKQTITRHTIEEAKFRYNILLAEDNHVNQALAMELLNGRGHHVELAMNGLQAVEALEKGSFDFILMDIQMPEMDGLEATKIIREKETGSSHIPIIAMTAHAMQGDREKCLEAGMDEYISKPIKAKELFDKIDLIMSHTNTKDDREITMEQGEKDSTEIFNASEALEVVGGRKDLLMEIAGIFLENLPGDIDKIRESITMKDSDMLENAAHSLKGAIGNFGTRRCFDAAYRLEKMGSGNQMEFAEAALRKLEEELILFQAELSNYLKEIENENTDC